MHFKTFATVVALFITASTALPNEGKYPAPDTILPGATNSKANLIQSSPVNRPRPTAAVSASEAS